MTTTNTPAPTATSELALRPGQTAWSDDQVAVLRQMGLEHAEESDLKLFYHYAARTGLDPFTRQVYMVSRRTKVKVREVNPETGNERLVERDVDRFTIQVGVDGWRVLGNRAAHRDGVRVGHKAPLYAGKDGVWSSIWTSDTPPVACQYTLLADGVEVTAICYYAEYVQYSGRGEVTSMWKKMPLNQLAKCFSADTEVLTVNGYKRFNQVGPSDLIMQVTDDGLSPVSAVPFVQQYDGPMVAVHGDMLDFCVTPNHDMVTDHGKVEASALHALATAKPAVRIPLTAPANTVEHPGVSDDDLRLLGYVIADGREDGPRYKVAVSRQYKIDQLERLDPVSVAVRHTKGAEAVTAARVVRTNFDKMVYRFDAGRLAAWLLAGKQINTARLAGLSQRQARIVIDAWQEFDGHTDRRSGARRLFTSREDHVAAAEILATLAGYTVNAPRKRVSDISDRPNYIITISEAGPVPVVRRAGSIRPQIAVEPSNPTGEVWCVTVPSGRIMVRRNGFGMVCGNCTEALAWRKAFPADFAGLVLEDAAQAEVIDGQVIDQDAPAAAPPKRARGGDRVRERAKAAAKEEDHPRAAREAAKAGTDPEAERRAALIGDLDRLLKLGQVDKFADMAIIVAELGGLDAAPAKANEVSTETLAVVVDKLDALAKSGDSRPFGEVLDDVFNRWLARHPEGDGEGQS